MSCPPRLLRLSKKPPFAMRTALLLGAALFVAAPAIAQTDSHTEAALELLDVLDMEEQITGNLDDMLSQMMGMGGPQPPEGLVEVMLEFFEEIYVWEDLRPQFAAIYRDLYTEEEIRQLIEFYRTDLGQRLVETMPEAAVRGMTITQKLMVDNMPEFQRRMMEFLQSQREKQ